MIFGFQSEVKPCEATLSPPIYREAIADRVNRAICSAPCGANRVCEANVNDYHNGALKFRPLIRYVLAKISQILDTICA
ncbi:hypothetical protein CCVT_0776 [Campylobacter curvus]|nr:hypothetical protein CCVT_0776 [Campylobacter curvus]